MIDLKLELQNYQLINLKDLSEDGGILSDNIRNSVTLYNKAIESLRSGSEDIAIIELKKAISMNPRFYEAMNLLGICYSYINDNTKAAEVFEKVVKAENNSVRAMRYLSLLNSGDEVFSTRMRTKKKPVSDAGTVEKPRREAAAGIDLKRLWMQNATRVLAGFFAGAVLIAAIFLLNPQTAKSQDTPGNTDDPDTRIIEELQQTKVDYEKLDADYKLLQQDKEAANKAADYYKSVIKLYEIERQAGKKQYEAAADMLLLMKTVEFRDEDKQKFDDLYKSVMPSAASTVYDEGYNLYNKKKYEDSFKKLEKVQLYNPAFERMDAVLYYMGRCSQQLMDSRSAIAYFQKLVDTYPKSSYAKNAKVRIQDLTKQP